MKTISINQERSSIMLRVYDINDNLIEECEWEGALATLHAKTVLKEAGLNEGYCVYKGKKITLKNRGGWYEFENVEEVKEDISTEEKSITTMCFYVFDNENITVNECLELFKNTQIKNKYLTSGVVNYNKINKGFYENIRQNYKKAKKVILINCDFCIEQHL